MQLVSISRGADT